MRINLEELGVLESQRVRLREVLERLEAECADMQYRGKPELAAGEWKNIMRDIRSSFVTGCRIRIRTWDPFSVEELSGTVKIVNPKPLQIKLELTEEEFRWIWVAHILGTST